MSTTTLLAIVASTWGIAMALSPTLQIRHMIARARRTASRSPTSACSSSASRSGSRTGSRCGNLGDHRPEHDRVRRRRDRRSPWRGTTGSSPPPLAARAAEAAVAEREPRRAASGRTSGSGRPSARCTSTREPRDDARRGRLLERGGPLDRDAADARVLEREPAQDARGASSLLCVLERGVAEPRRVEQEREQRPLRRVAGDGERERREQLGVVLVDRRVDELPACPRATSLRPRSRSRRWTPSSRPRSGLERLDREPALVRPLRASRRGARRASAASSCARVVDRRGPRAAAGSAPRRRSGSRGGRREAARAAGAPPRRARGSAFAQTMPVSTPTWPRSTRPKRPARPAICAISHGSRSRRSSPSNFVVSAKSSVSQGRLTPCPSTSVATADVGRAARGSGRSPRGASERHRAVEHGDPARLAGG